MLLNSTIPMAGNQDSKEKSTMITWVLNFCFLTLLIDKYLVLDDDACRGEMRKEIRRFINHHILVMDTGMEQKNADLMQTHYLSRVLGT